MLQEFGDISTQRLDWWSSQQYAACIPFPITNNMRRPQTMDVYRSLSFRFHGFHLNFRNLVIHSVVGLWVWDPSNKGFIDAEMQLFLSPVFEDMIVRYHGHRAAIRDPWCQDVSSLFSANIWTLPISLNLHGDSFRKLDWQKGNLGGIQGRLHLHFPTTVAGI